MHLGAGQVQALGDDGQRIARDVAIGVLDGVEDRQQRPLHPFMGVKDFPTRAAISVLVCMVGGPFGSCIPGYTKR